MLLRVSRTLLPSANVTTTLSLLLAYTRKSYHCMLSFVSLMCLKDGSVIPHMLAFSTGLWERSSSCRIQSALWLTRSCYGNSSTIGSYVSLLRSLNWSHLIGNLVEERALVNFFGQDYITYRSRVGTKIPFIP